MNTVTTKTQIKRWMGRNAGRFVDPCGEVNATALVEAWDCETQDGTATLDPDHIAWDVAVDVAEAHESETN